MHHDKNIVGVYDSFVSTTQDTKDTKETKIDEFGGKLTSNHDIKLKSNGKYINFTKKSDLIRFHNNELEAINSRKMKRTDGFMAFRPSIGAGNSSNSLLPSSSGDTIANRYAYLLFFIRVIGVTISQISRTRHHQQQQIL